MSNICERCGGQKTVWFTVTAMPEGQPSLAVSDASFTLCLCPPAREKHNGELLTRFGDFNARVWIDGAYIRIEEMNRQIVLDAKQALSLLAWLKQEEATLEQLTQEQGE